MEPFVLIALITAAIILFALATAHARKKRREALMAKYGDANIVDMIMRRMFWVGQTEQQLVDSLGRPNDVDQRVLRSKVKETWKYHETGRNRFGLRITVENGFVVGWDQKD
jgi:hypothetical protein